MLRTKVRDNRYTVRQLEVAQSDHVAGEIRSGVRRPRSIEGEDRAARNIGRGGSSRVARCSSLIPVQGASTCLRYGLERIGSGVCYRYGCCEPSQSCYVGEQQRGTA